MHKITRLLFFFVCIALWFSSCVERDRSNPFDPNSDNTDILSLLINPSVQQVTLKWILSVPLDNFDGFRVYRAVDEANNFIPLTDLAANEYEFTDTNVEQNRWYFYRVVAFAATEETRPSNTKRTYLGPGINWVLATDGYSVKKLSYDLLNVIEDYETSVAPLEWSVSPGDSLIWLAYEQFAQSIGTVNKTTGNKGYFSPDSVLSTRDIEVNRNNNYVYILDDSGDKIAVFSDGFVREIFQLDGDDSYEKMVLDTQNNRLLVLGEKKMFILNASQLNSLPFSLSFQGELAGKDFDLSGNTVYILASSTGENRSELYTLVNNNITNTLELNNAYYRMLFDNTANRFFLVEDIVSGDDQLVQLSPDGTRQVHSTGYGNVQQIAINPYDRSVIVVDYWFNLVRLYNSQGDFISESRAADDRKLILGPSRVYIE